MTKDILTKYLEHFNYLVRKIIPPTVHVLLLLDGHKSRKGIECVEKGVPSNIVIAKSPANTSHYSQAADQDINFRLQRSGKHAKDIMSSITRKRFSSS